MVASLWEQTRSLPAEQTSPVNLESLIPLTRRSLPLSQIKLRAARILSERAKKDNAS